MISKQMAEKQVDEISSHGSEVVNTWNKSTGSILRSLMEIRGHLDLCGVDDEHVNSGLLAMVRSGLDQIFGTISMTDLEMQQLSNCITYSESKAIGEINRAEPYEVDSVKDMDVRIAVWDMTEGHCAYCDCEVDYPETDYEIDDPLGPIPLNKRMPMHIEHVVPASRGGPDNLSNYVPSCQKCNSSKSDGHVLEFIRRVQGKEKSISQPVQLVSDNARQQA